MNKILGPDQFFIIASDSSVLNFFNLDSEISIANFPTLNNSGDKIILLDSLNRVIDSLEYSPGWGGNNGFSLERILYNNTSNDSTNWRTSISKNKATPGKPNSVIGLKSYSKNELVVNEIMFDPAPDNSEFIEFLNTRSTPINIAGWYFEDKNKDVIYLSNVDREVKGNSFFVLAADSLIINNYHFSDKSILHIPDHLH